MDYDTLMEKARTKEAFIYGRSVMQIVETQTYEEGDRVKTDFIYKTERNNRGIITREKPGMLRRGGDSRQ